MATYYVDDATGNDSNAGTSEGAAWKTISKALSTVAAGDLVNIKNTNDYTITTALAATVSGTVAAGPVVLRGYTSTPGDGGRFKVKTSTNSINLLDIQCNFMTIQDFEFHHEASTRGRGIVASSAVRDALSLRNGKIVGPTFGVDAEYLTNWTIRGLVCENLEVVSCASVGIAGDAVISGCLIRGCGDAIHRSVYANYPWWPTMVVDRCILYNNTNGIVWSINEPATLIVNQTVIRKNTSHGINISSTTPMILAFVMNSIVYDNGGYGITAAAKLMHLLRANAFGSNTSGNYHTTYFTNAVGDVSLSGDPHTNAVGLDFSLNNTAGAGAACRAAGFPGAFLGGSTTGYLDIGAAQHQDPAASGGLLTNPGMGGGMRG